MHACSALGAPAAHVFHCAMPVTTDFEQNG